MAGYARDYNLTHSSVSDYRSKGSVRGYSAGLYATWFADDISKKGAYIDKKGPLNNPADRDHCIQYMVAIPLLFGRLTAADYEDNVAQDKRIDALREKINCFEDPAFTADYHDPEKRAIANAITLEKLYCDDNRLRISR